MAGRRHAVAIVGAGSAGTAAAWQLRLRYGDGVDLTVFERGPHEGGRAWDVPFAGTRIEVGGTALHSTDQHTMDLMRYAGAVPATSDPTTDGEPETFAFWTSRGLPIHVRTSLLSTALGVVRHVGLGSVRKVVKVVGQLADSWSRVYELQAAGEVYPTPKELLAALQLADQTGLSFREYLRAQEVSERAIDDVVEPMVHNLYNQGAEISALAAGLGLASTGLAGGYSVAVGGGNWTLFARALAQAGATVRLRTAVTRVDGRTVGRQSYRLSTTAGETDDFDAVVIAAPFALSGLRVAMDGIPRTYPVHPYQEVHTTLVAGELSGSPFGLKPGKRLPSTVFVADSAGAPVDSLGVAGYSPVHGSRIYKLFSADRPVATAVVDRLFARVDEVYQFVWPGAYPVFAPGLAPVPFALAPGLFYACALETAAASFEVEAVGGVNAAGLAVRYLDGLPD